MGTRVPRNTGVPPRISGFLTIRPIMDCITWEGSGRLKARWRREVASTGTKRREIPHIRRPTRSQERKRKKKLACCARNNSGWGGRVNVGAKAPTPKGQASAPSARGDGGRGMRLLECGFDELHGSDGVELVPTMVGVVDVRTPAEIALATYGF